MYEVLHYALLCEHGAEWVSSDPARFSRVVLPLRGRVNLTLPNPAGPNRLGRDGALLKM